MPTNSRVEETKKEDGTTAEKLVVEFSNGSLKQLRELAEYYKSPDDDPAQVIELAIALLERFRQDAKKSGKDS